MKNINNGFTLMELLVVIVIISLLVAMLFPVFGRIQERGRSAKCTSNLRQLHTAAINYMNAKGGSLPVAANALKWEKVNGVWQEIGWTTGWVATHSDDKSYWWEAAGSNGTYCVQNGTLFPYLGDVGDESVYVCPTMSKRAREVMNGDMQNVTRSYGMNRALSGVKYSSYDGLSRTILFADQGFDVGTYDLKGGAEGSGPPDDPDPDDANLSTNVVVYYQSKNTAIDGCIDYNDGERIGELHGSRPGANYGMGNAVFADGHVEQVVNTQTPNVCSGNWEYGAPVQ